MCLVEEINALDKWFFRSLLIILLCKEFRTLSKGLLKYYNVEAHGHDEACLCDFVYLGLVYLSVF